MMIPIAFTDDHERTETVLIIKFSIQIHEKRTIAIESSWHPICILHIIERLFYHPAASPEKRAELWWSDNIHDFQRHFPALSSTRVASTRLIERWISHEKDAGSKVPFKPPRE
jgi:hypothetical protein